MFGEAKDVEQNIRKASYANVLQVAVCLQKPLRAIVDLRMVGDE